MISQTTNRYDASALPLSRRSSQFQHDLVALLPDLQRYSRSLCQGRGIAEDMAQDTLESAWQAQDRFEPGTNLKAWLFTILRNTVHSHSRRSWRNAHWDPEKGENIAGPANQQEWTVELSETVRAMYKLPKDQRDALITVSIGGASYEDAAKKFGTAVGTVRSRIARGRDALLSILAGGEAGPCCSYAPAEIPSFAPTCLQP